MLRLRRKVGVSLPFMPDLPLHRLLKDSRKTLATAATTVRATRLVSALRAYLRGDRANEAESVKLWCRLAAVASDARSSPAASLLVETIPSYVRDPAVHSSSVWLLTKLNAHNELRHLFEKLRSANIPLRKIAFDQLFRSATRESDAEYVSEIWGYATSQQYCPDVVTLSTLVAFYGKCERPAEARNMFDLIRINSRDIVSWNVLISAHAATAASRAKVPELLHQLESTPCVPNANTILSVLHCALVDRNYELATTAWGLAGKSGCQSDPKVFTMTVDCYAKCGNIDAATTLFKSVPSAIRTVVAWSVFISAHSLDPALCSRVPGLLDFMDRDQVKPDIGLVQSILKCATLERNWALGQEAWRVAVSCGISNDPRILGCMVDLAGKCQLPAEAQRMFNLIAETDHSGISFSVLIAAFSSDPKWRARVPDTLRRMQNAGIRPNAITILAILKCAVASCDWELGTEAWALAQSCDCENEVNVLNSFIDLCGKCSRPHEAEMMFRRISPGARTIASWNALFFALSSSSSSALSVHELLTEMEQSSLRPNDVTVLGVLRCATTLADVSLGQRAWRLAEAVGCEKQISVLNSLVHLYGTLGMVEEARGVFNIIPERSRTLVSWNVLIASYASSITWRTYDNVNALITEMEQHGFAPNHLTVLAVVKCAIADKSIDLTNRAWTIAQLSNSLSDVLVLHAFIDAFGKCGKPEEAQRVFDRVPPKSRSVLSWNVLLGAYAEDPKWSKRANSVFNHLLESGIPVDTVTTINLLKCASSALDVELGEKVWEIARARNFHTDAQVVNLMIDLYGKCGRPVDAQQIFELISPDGRSVVYWSNLIAAYASDPIWRARVPQLLDQFQASGVLANAVTVLSVLKCASAEGSLQLGERAWKMAEDLGCSADERIISAMIYLYGKTAHVADAERLFARLSKPNEITYPCMISAYASSGMGDHALDLYHQAVEQGVRMTVQLCVVVLKALSHSMMVAEARLFYASLSEDFRSHAIVLSAYIDCLSRTGHLEEAEQSLCKFHESHMPGFMAVLGGCRKYNDISRAERVFDLIKTMNPAEVSAYVLMGNIYGRAGMEEKKEQILQQMRALKLKKLPGVTTCIVDGKSVTFSTNADQKVHGEMPLISLKMKEMYERMLANGHQPDTSWVGKKFATEEERRQALCHHSERYAMAFALLKTEDRADITLLTNIRTCGDCHESIRLLSRIYDRKILLRDASRFHCFEGGKCDCNDHW